MTINTIGLLLSMGLVTALANRWAGWEHGDRYTCSIFIGFMGWLFLGLPGICIGAAMLGWRLVGWHKSLDMGRNENSILRDFFVMALISIVPALIMVFIVRWWLPMSLILTMPICYAIAMRSLPWEPKYKHIAIAEILAGFIFGITGAISIILM